ncbi:hypothetical protein [Halosimplex carlsbadense]|nr:hypothetical protein [Halosimplex carlsbadense]
MGLADAIAEAFWGFFQHLTEDIANELSTALTDELIKGLLRIPNPYDSANAGAAWDGVFEISMVLLPIAIAVSLIAWPFSEDREGGLMEMAVRVVMVIFFVGISQPAWGFAIDATNAVTVAILDLDPDPGSLNYGYGNDLTGASLTTTSFALEFIVSVVSAILALLALLLSIFFLLLRWFMVWMAFIGTPFFAVIWFLGRGPLKAAGDVGATFLRMGLFSLLGGPIIAIVVLTFQVLEQGGILQTIGNGAIGNVGLQFAELVLILMFPIVLIITVWKMVSWAGQPLGVGEAASKATIAVAALAGAAVTGGVGGAAIAGGGGSGGGAAAGSGSAAASGGAGGASGAAGASSGAGASGAAGASGSGAASATPGAGGSGLANRLASPMKGAASKAMNRGAQKMPGSGTVKKTVENARKRLDTGTARSNLDGAREVASQVQAKSEFVTKAVNEQTLDLDQANDYEILPESPAESSEADVYTDRETGATMASYQGESGQEHQVNLSEAVQRAGSEKQEADADVAAKESTLDRLEKAHTAAHYGKEGVKTSTTVGARAGSTAVRTGTGALVGGASGNSYLAYSIGQNAAKPLIGPSGGSTGRSRSPNHTLDEFGMVASGQAGAANSDLVNGGEK